MTELFSMASEYALRMDIYEIRRRNFARILALPRVARLRLEKDRAAFFGLSGSMWSQLRNPAYRIGDPLARRLEATLDLPTAWMDVDQAERDSNAKKQPGEMRPESQNETLDRVMLDAAEAWVRFEEGAGIEFQPVRRLERLMEIARMMRDNGGALSPTQAQQLIDAVRNRG